MVPSIEIAAHAGVCYGVERALAMAQDAGEHAPKPVRTLGPLIHNPLVVRDLAQAGVESIDAPEQLSEGTVVIRAHGVIPAVIEDARARGLHVLDATCPYVKRVHAAAEKLCREGYRLIVVGESGHPEVEGIMGHADGRACVVSCASDVAALDISGRVGMVVQTTQTVSQLNEVIDAVLPHASELRIVNTICRATSERQAAARELAARVDVMVVVGGKNSGNTRRLAQICRENCAATHHIEDAKELEPAWFDRVQHIGITAGASTPQAHIECAVHAISSLVGCERHDT